MNESSMILQTGTPRERGRNGIHGSIVYGL